MARARARAVYLLTNSTRSVLYTGVTADLVARTWTHRAMPDPRSFAGRYRARVLVYYEVHETMEAAIRREKQLKGWRREKKVALVERANPGWRDLWPEIAGADQPDPSC